MKNTDKSSQRDRLVAIEGPLKAWREGRLVALPTETVYGLGAPVDRDELIKKIFAVKERPFFDPLIVHVSNTDMAKKYSKNWSEALSRLANAYWPGPLTIVVKKSELISPLITSGLETVGLRVPKNELSLSLISALGVGVAAPSANKFTKTSPTCAEHVSSQFSSDDVYVLEGEASVVGIESTIATVDEDLKVLTILRPGILTGQELLDTLGENYKLAYGKTAFESSEEVSINAPGQFKSHYRPDYPLGFKVSDLEPAYFIKKYPECEFLELSVDPYVTARELYSTMRLPLARNYTRKYFLISGAISKLSDKEQEVWQGIFNRLSKAATFSLDD